MIHDDGEHLPIPGHKKMFIVGTHWFLHTPHVVVFLIKSLFPDVKGCLLPRLLFERRLWCSGRRSLVDQPALHRLLVPYQSIARTVRDRGQAVLDAEWFHEDEACNVEVLQP